MQLSCLLLMAAAAVPLLGEPQINKQTNEAKATRQETKVTRQEAKATRQENRNTIREGESLSSCPTGSTSFSHDDERSPLLLELPTTAKLFGQPGTRHRSPLNQSYLFLPKILFHQDHDFGLQDSSDCDKPRFCTHSSDALPPRGLSS